MRPKEFLDKLQENILNRIKEKMLEAESDNQELNKQNKDIRNDLSNLYNNYIYLKQEDKELKARLKASEDICIKTNSLIRKKEKQIEYLEKEVYNLKKENQEHKEEIEFLNENAITWSRDDLEENQEEIKEQEALLKENEEEIKKNEEDIKRYKKTLYE